MPSLFLTCLKYISQTDQKIQNLPAEKAERLAGSDPDYNNRMLYNAIANKNPVSLPLLQCS